MTNEIILQSLSKEELRDMVQEMVRTEFQIINREIQRVIGEDDLVSTEQHAGFWVSVPKF